MLSFSPSALLVLCSLTNLAVAKCPTPTVPSVTVKNGTYDGVYSPEYDQDFFLGVAFAQPPVGPLSFQVPQSLNTSWKNTKPAQSYSSACVGGFDQIFSDTSEDCLYLNVVRPRSVSKKFQTKLPVVVWIHGGNLVTGSGIDQSSNLSFIVQKSVDVGKPIIAVSINYRLGIWGWLTGKEVVKAGVANLGMRDQRLALHWLQENIAAFGGRVS